MAEENLLEKLLEQIQWPESQQEYFQDAELTELVVHQVSQSWTFRIKIAKILPFAVFNQFLQQLTQAFAGIAKVNLDLTTINPEFNAIDLQTYWQFVVQDTGIKSPMIAEVCANQTPELKDNLIFLSVENEIVKSFMVKQAIGPIEEAYQRAGFPKLSFRITVDESQVQEKIKDLKAHQAQHEQEFAQQAAKQQE